MVQSAVINEAIVFITALSMRAVIRRTEEGKLPETFRYFTVLSNLFCAFTALILLVCEFCGVLPAWAATLKYMGTVAVTLTFLVVLLFLWPSLGSIQGLWVTPLLAVLSFLFYEKQGLSAWIIPLGLLPVLLYGWLYLDRVVVTKTWRDMYGFNKNGRWKPSFSLLVLGTVAIAVLLWWL